MKKRGVTKMKNGVYADYKIFAGNAHKVLAEEIASIMGKPMGKSVVTTFSDGETSVSLFDIVRGLDCYIVQPTCDPVNTNLVELLIMIDAMKRASAGRINVVIPYYGYARQDRKAKARDPITAKLVANIIVAAGADRMLSMDLHAPQIQGYFDIPVDHLLGLPVLIKYIKNRHLDDIVIVAPDHGSVVRARNMAEHFNCPIAIVDKRRPGPNKSEVMHIVGDIEGKTAVLIDDMVDTAGSITNAANAVAGMGAKEVYACATHPVLSGKAIERIKDSAIKEMVLLNTIPVPEEKLIDKIKVLSVAPLFAEAMNRIFTNESISKLFN